MVLRVKVDVRSWLLWTGCYLFAGLFYIWPQYFWQDESRDLHRLLLAIGWLVCWLLVLYKNAWQRRWFWLCLPSLLLIAAPRLEGGLALILWSISGFN